MNKIFKSFLLLFIPMLALVVTGCVEEDDYVDLHPRLAAVSPVRGKPGTEVMITGRNLGNVSSVMIGTLEVPVNQKTDNSVSITVPTAAEVGSQQIRVTTPNGVSVLNFEVQGAVEMPDYVIFNEELNPQWQIWGGWGGAVGGSAQIGNTPMEGAGTKNLVVTWTDAGGGYQLAPAGPGAPNPFTLSAYKAIRISVKGGAGFEGKKVMLQIQDKAGKDSGEYTMVLTESAYQTFVISLSALGNPPSIADIRLKNEVAGTIYVDAFGLDQ